MPQIDSSEVPRALVIGSGFGGLALAIRLQSMGFSVQLLEQRDKPGGRAYVYTRKGYVFDAGPTVITDPNCLAQLFELSGRRIDDYVELMPVMPFYRLVWEDGTQFDYSHDIAELEQEIARLNPADVAGYHKFLAYSQTVYKEGYEKLGSVPFLSFSQMIQAAPQLLRLKAYRSVYGQVSKFIQNDKLRQAFSFHTLLVGGNPFKTSSIYTLIHALEYTGGVWFAKGGTRAVIEGLVQLFTDLGGELLLRHRVCEIRTQNNRVVGLKTTDGAVYEADLIASNADVVHSYKDLLAGHKRGRSYGQRLARKSHSMSLFVLYFGLRTEHPHLKHHTILFGQRYKQLITEIFGKTHRLPEDFSLYLHAPSVSDKSLAPPGCSTYYVLTPVPHLGHADIDWVKILPAYQDKILRYLEKYVIPDLHRDLEVVLNFTPLGFRDELNAHLGSAFSLEPILTQSAWFRPHNRDNILRNFYIVGAGTHPGAGIPGVVGSAKATAGIIARDFGLKAGRDE